MWSAILQKLLKVGPATISQWVNGMDETRLGGFQTPRIRFWSALKLRLRDTEIMTEHDVAPKLKWLQLSTSQNSQNIPFCPENTDNFDCWPRPSWPPTRCTSSAASLKHLAFGAGPAGTDISSGSLGEGVWIAQQIGKTYPRFIIIKSSKIPIQKMRDARNWGTCPIFSDTPGCGGTDRIIKHLSVPRIIRN